MSEGVLVALIGLAGAGLRPVLGQQQANPVPGRVRPGVRAGHFGEQQADPVPAGAAGEKVGS